MPAHSASKDARERAYVAGIHDFKALQRQRRGWPGQAGHDGGECLDHYEGWYKLVGWVERQRNPSSRLRDRFARLDVRLRWVSLSLNPSYRPSIAITAARCRPP